MPGILLYQRWYGHIARLVLATARNERHGLPILKVWPGGQRYQVTHIEIPARHITGGDVGGCPIVELHGGGRLVLGETLKADPMPVVWS